MTEERGFGPIVLIEDRLSTRDEGIAEVYNQPMNPYPNTNDIGGTLLTSIYDDTDFGDQFRQGILSVLGMGDLRKLAGRLDDGRYPPGWATLTMFRANEVDENPDQDPRTDPREEQEEVVIPGLSHVIPPIPLRLDNVDYYDDAFAEKIATTSQIDKICRNAGIDADAILSEILESDEIIGNEDKLDDIHVNFCVRLFDHSEAGKHYLYDFFEQIATEFEIEYIPGEGGCIYEEDPEGLYCNRILMETAGITTEFRFIGVFVSFTAVADLVGLESEAYYSDKRKFNDDGSLRRTYYTSSTIFGNRTGYLVSKTSQVYSYLDGGTLPRALPLVPDDHFARNCFRVDYPVAYGGGIYDQSGADTGEDTLWPERFYCQDDHGRVMIVEPTYEDEALTSYYKVTAEGLHGIHVAGPYGLSYLTDGDGDGTRNVVHTKANVNELVVPVFMSILNNMDKKSDSVDAFLSSLHTTIYLIELTPVDMPAWKILAVMVIVVISMWNPYGWAVFAAGGALSAGAIVTMTLGYIIGRIVVNLLKDFSPIFTAIALVVIAWISGGAKNPFTSLSTAVTNFTSLAKLLSEFVIMLSKVVTAYIKQLTQSILDETNAMIEEYQDEITYLESLFPTSSLDTDFLIDITSNSKATNIPMPISAETFVDSIDSALSLGSYYYDYDAQYKDALATPQLL